LIRLEVRHSMPPARMFRDSKVARQLPFATIQAINAVAVDVKTDNEGRLGQVFDRPTPFTKRGFLVLRANRGRPYADVKAKDIQERYLALQETGGERRPAKRALTVPKGARLNQHGNLPRGGVKRMLGRADTFSGRVRGVGGIWQRMAGGRVKLLVAWEPRASYRPRFGFKGRAMAVIRQNYPMRFRQEFAKALATAK
jgi:hypothetical protein